MKKAGVTLKEIAETFGVSIDEAKKVFDATFSAVSVWKKEERSIRSKDMLKNSKNNGVNLGKKRSINRSEVLRLKYEGMNNSAIARELSCSRASVGEILRKQNEI